MLTWKEKRFKRIGKRFARRYSLIYWGHILWIASHIVGVSYRDWSSVDKDISRLFATKRKLPQKGAGLQTSYKSYDLLAYNLVFYAPFTIYFSVFIAHCWMHVSFWWNIRPDCNLDVSTLFKKPEARNFPSESAVAPFWFAQNRVSESKSTLQVAVRWISSWDVDFTDSDIRTLLRFAWRTGWGGANLLLFQFFTPTQSDNWPVFLFVFVLVCVWGCMNICVRV